MRYFAPGLPDRNMKSPLPSTSSSQFAEFVIQDHNATNQHYDMRIGMNGIGYSWVIRSIPKPGEKVLAVRQPDHSIEYFDFSGVIKDGYGKGTVRTHTRDKVEVLKSSPEKITFYRYPGSNIEKYTLIHTGGDNWVFLNHSSSKEIEGYVKDKYLTYKDMTGKYREREGDLKLPKLDGAHAIMVLRANKTPILLSKRISKRNGLPIEYTPKLPSILNSLSPADLKTTIVRGEVYSDVPANKLSGMLNSNVLKSREEQARTSPLRFVGFDVTKFQNKSTIALPYQERLNLIEKIHKIYPQVNSITNEPPSLEGIVVWRNGKPIKVKDKLDFDVYTQNIFPTEKNDRAGGIEYSLTPTGPIVGRVGCVELGTIISGNMGLYEIENVPNYWSALSINKDSLNLEIKDITHYHKPRKVAGIKIKTFSGFELTGSKNHPILTKNFEFKSLNSLQVGDYVAISKPYIGNDEYLHLNSYTINPSISYLIGLYLAEGSSKDKRYNSFKLSLNINESELAEKVKNILIEEFQEKRFYIKDITRKSLKDITFTSSTFRNILKELGLFGITSKYKFIPSIFFTSKVNLQNLLMGLFDGDGGYTFDDNYYNYGPYFVSASKKLSQQIHFSLLGLDIISSFIEEESTYNDKKVYKYSIRIRSKEGINKYHKLIGFNQLEKKARSKIKTKKREGGNDIIPISPDFIEGWLKETGVSWREVIRNIEGGTTLYNWKKRKSISRLVFSQILDYFTKLGIDTKFYYNYLEFYWRKIISKELVDSEVVDITVKDNSTYWSNGFISHNTGWSHLELKDMLKNKNKYKGLVARISAQEQYKNTGALRAPSFIEWHKEKNL